MIQQSEKGNFMLKADPDLLEALRWKARQLRSSATRVLTDYLLTIKQEQENAEKGVMQDGIEPDQGTGTGAATAA